MNRFKNYMLSIVLCICSGLWLTANAQYNIPKKPKKSTEQTSVYDYTNLLTISEKNSLETKLIKYSDTTSTQIVVVIIPSAKGESIGVLTPRWAHKWGIGQADKDNGVFILLAKTDRKIWISPGYGVEHKLTAGITGEITRKIIIPEFKKGNYYNGLNKGTSAIIKVLEGTYKDTRISNRNKKSVPEGVLILLFIIFFIILVSLSKRKNKGNQGGRSGGLSPLDIIILSRAGRSSGGFSGGGFGGGGFSGGGAGGSW